MIQTMSPATARPHAPDEIPEPTPPPTPKKTPIFSKSSKSKASKLSKQAKVFASKSDKSGTVKSGKSGKGGKALFQESSEGTGWWSASRTVSYLNSGSDYTPFGLERKSSASVMHGAGWIVIATAVLFSSTFVH
ncbi:hypothetical protein ACHAXA_003847 [Cyclostephanos tholiformis]|uniref:Uncharacterized protein n=1 Tax=Cyclostephanos tholiformis TaxID=382380 RepID=A0ABD3R5U1_9STRA